MIVVVDSFQAIFRCGVASEERVDLLDFTVPTITLTLETKTQSWTSVVVLSRVRGKERHDN